MKRIETSETDPESNLQSETSDTSRSASRTSTVSTKKKPSTRLLTGNLLKKTSNHNRSKTTDKTVKGPNKIPPKSNQTNGKKRNNEMITLNLSTMTGSEFTIQAFPNDTIARLKERIYQESRIIIESQMLIYNGKHITSDTSQLNTLGISDGSKIQIVLQMAGGPGPPIQLKKAIPEDDQVVFLLCKQNQEIYVLEVHLKDGIRPKTVTKHHLRLQSPMQGNKLLEFLESNECFDISDMCELQIDLETPPLTAEDSQDSSVQSRPTSGTSTYSFVSSKLSRPTTVDSDQSFSESTTQEFRSLFWESEWLLSAQEPPTSKSTTSSNIRPATAISIMRLPTGARPMIIIPKTRPASAEKWIEGFKNHIQSRESAEDKEFLSTLNKTNSNDQESLDYFQSQNEKKDRSGSRGIKSPKKNSKKPTTTNSLSKQKQINQEHVLQFSSKADLSRKSSPRKLTSSTRKRTPAAMLNPIPVSKKIVCTQCQKKLGPAQLFTCKCKKSFCSIHRYSDRHDCSFDYKTEGKAVLQRNNPLVKTDKCIKL